jgi:ribosomal protein S18 acetylase RimI-like enzyme
MTPNAPGPRGTRAAPDGGTMPPAVIRCFAPADHPAARALWEATPGVGLSAADERDAIERFLGRNPGLSFVAALDRRVIGTILCGHDGRRGLIHHLVVAPDSRHHGLGRTLLQRGLEALRGAGIDKCHLLIFGSNDAGLAFWRAIGADERRELALFSLPTTEELPHADHRR